jgi:VWFA-related protein
MFRLRTLFCAALAIAALSIPVGAGNLVQFISPQPGDLVTGMTQIQLAVINGTRHIERVDLYVRGRLIGTAFPPEWSLTWDAPTNVSADGIDAVVYEDGSMVGKVRLDTREFYFGESINISAVQLYPVVVDRRGRYIKNLSADDFRIYDQGQPVEIEHFATEATSLSIAVVLDKSNSMSKKIGVVQNASCGFVDKLGEEDEVSVYAFNQQLERIIAPTRLRGPVKRGIRTLEAGGGTALYDALIRVLEDMEGVTGRKAIFLFSDGLDELSLAGLEMVIDAARDHRAIIYTVGAGQDERSARARMDLRMLAEETGGEVHFIERFEELPTVFDAILDHLRSQYVLSYRPSPGPPGTRSLEIRCDKRSYRVRCRKSYYHQGS